ncbi:hypothetical protein PENTCL1PPCAC_5412, partial [Pristionchus entomophagus]
LVLCSNVGMQFVRARHQEWFWAGTACCWQVAVLTLSVSHAESVRPGISIDGITVPCIRNCAVHFLVRPFHNFRSAVFHSFLFARVIVLILRVRTI